MTDIDILSIDNEIMENFEKEKILLPKYLKKLKNLQKILNTENITDRTKNTLEKRSPSNPNTI